MMDFESVSWEHLFFYWFQGRNLLVDDQNFKRGEDIKKREDQISISRRESTCFIGREGGEGGSVSLLKPSFKTHFSFVI